MASGGLAGGGKPFVVSCVAVEAALSEEDTAIICIIEVDDADDGLHRI